jgi:predicted ATPase/DNA-binding CsgD family transcriptional regulator
MEIQTKPRHNLPSQPTSFIGRENEIAEIVALLTEPACRLLTLIGPGGIGKTRLAVEVARRLKLDDGAYFVPLQPLRSIDDIVTTIVDALPLQLHGSTDPQQQLLDYLRERHMLLILDNFEHLLDGASLVTGILGAAPHVRLLVTSREALNLRAEHLWPLGGLPIPPDDALDVFDDYSAVQLFVERTRRVKPDFSSAAQKHEIVRICRLVDGLPLALELAAGWTRALSPQAIGDEIERSIDFLASNQRDMPERHRSMRAVFERSWRLLSEEEQTVFSKLSVFRGGFTLEAAEQVAEASLTLLASLIDKSLLRLDVSGRYDLHELVRQYAQEQLETARETEAILDAHCRYYAGFLHEHEDAIHDHRELVALNAIHHDFENIRAAWQRAVRQADETAVNRMMHSLFSFCVYRGRVVTGLALWQQALAGFAPSTETMPSLVWGRLIVRKCRLIFEAYTRQRINRVSDLLRSELQQALEIARHYEDRWEAAHCLLGLGSLEFNLDASRYEIGCQLLEQGFNLLDETGDNAESVHLRLEYALALRSSGGHPATVRGLVQQALEIARSAGNSSMIALALLFSAWIHHYDEGDLTAAQLAIDEALTHIIQVDDKRLIGDALWHKGLIAFSMGNTVELSIIGEKVIAIGTEYHNALTTVLGHALLGLANSLQENYQPARQYCLKAHQQLSGWARPYRFLITFGLVLAGCGLADVHTTREHLVLMLETAIDLQVPVYKLLCLPCAAALLTWENQHTRAVELLALAYTHPKSLNDWMKQWPLLVRLQKQLETELGAAVYVAAWERGKTLDLDTTTRELLALYESKPESSDLSANQLLTDRLTPRELEILSLIVEGYSNREIADHLVLALSTVKWHIKQTYSKLNVDSRTRAAARARELKLLM